VIFDPGLPDARSASWIPWCILCPCSA
jgi:hypothetical protein